MPTCQNFVANKFVLVAFVKSILVTINPLDVIFVANKLVKLLIAKNHVISKSKVLVLGITFKENCPDVRNTKAVDVINQLKKVNGMTNDQALEYLNESFAIWRDRSSKNYTLDISFLETY